MYTPAKTLAYEGIGRSDRPGGHGWPAAHRWTGAHRAIYPLRRAAVVESEEAAHGPGRRADPHHCQTPTTCPAICDGLNGVVWRDDVQAADGAWRKRYDSTPGVVVVTITPLAELEQVSLQLEAV